MKPSLHIALFLGSMLGASCTGANSQDRSVVLGSWEWSAACCSIAGQEKNPATEGYSYVLQYSEDGTVQAFRNNDLIATTGFTIKRSKPDPLADQITTVEYDQPLPHGPSIPPATKQAVFKTENGTLVLRNLQCADCYGEWRLLPRLTLRKAGDR